MGDEEVLLDAVLTGLGQLRGGDVFVLAIGAMDGASYDETRPYIDRFGWSGLFVEPVPEMFERLVRSYGETSVEPPGPSPVEGPARRSLGGGGRTLRFERAAVAELDGEIEMVRIPPCAVEASRLDPWVLGMSTILPPRNGFTSDSERSQLDRHGERIRVPSTTLPSLLAKHGVDRVDVLQIDVEGYDWTVLRQLDFDRYHPVVIRAEFCNLPPEERAAMRAHLEAQGYDVFRTTMDLVAVSRTAPRIDATFVTAVYERRPDDVVGGRGLPLARYLSSLRSIARMGAPLVVYTQHRHVAALTEFLAREGAPARVVGRTLSASPRFWPIQELRMRQRVHTLTYRDRCHVLCLEKFAWLAEQASRDLFRTSRYYWIDAGLSYPALFPARHLPRPPESVCDLFSPAVPAALATAPGFVVFELAPMAGRNLHSVDVADMDRLAGPAAAPITTHIVGGLFGGRREAVIELRAEYQAILADMLAAGLLGTEENVLTILYHRDRSRFTPQTFTTWHHEDTDFVQPTPQDVPFYRAFEQVAQT